MSTDAPNSLPIDHKPPQKQSPQDKRLLEKIGAKAQQREALTKLRAWVRRFTGIVVPALSDRPDLLAQLGLKPKGRPPPSLGASRPPYPKRAGRSHGIARCLLTHSPSLSRASGGSPQLAARREASVRAGRRTVTPLTRSPHRAPCEKSRAPPRSALCAECGTCASGSSRRPFARRSRNPAPRGSVPAATPRAALR